MNISSRQKKIFATVMILTIVSVGLLSFLTPVNEYKRVAFDSFGSDKERVTEECTCYGSLITMESSPPQYNCQGYEMCKSVNYTRPR